jgi:alkylation response protein AidB-like acyl-CoA dehydrogenase
MMSVLNKGRVGIGALAVGIARAGLEAAIEYAKQREQFGKPIADFQWRTVYAGGYRQRYRSRSSAGA